MQAPQPKVETVVKTDVQEQKPASFITSPQPGQILTEKKVQIAGNAKTRTKTLLISNPLTSITESQDDGNFKLEAEFPNGLSQLQIIVLNNGLEEIQNIMFPLYISEDKADKNSMFIAGTINRIFDNNITLSTKDGNSDIKITSSTKNIGRAKSPAKTSEEKLDIRVGDYLVAIGQKTPEILSAEKIEIFRENKPKIDASYAAVKIVSGAKNNIFSANTTKDNKLLEFTLNKNTQIIADGKKATSAIVTKDKIAIVIYKLENNNLVTLLHFL